LTNKGEASDHHPARLVVPSPWQSPGPITLAGDILCAIERGPERYGHRCLPERDYRPVYGERGPTQFIDHDGCSDLEA
jgi:hypothetical protein